MVVYIVDPDPTECQFSSSSALSCRQMHLLGYGVIAIVILQPDLPRQGTLSDHSLRVPAVLYFQICVFSLLHFPFKMNCFLILAG